MNDLVEKLLHDKPDIITFEYLWQYIQNINGILKEHQITNKDILYETLHRLNVMITQYKNGNVTQLDFYPYYDYKFLEFILWLLSYKQIAFNEKLSNEVIQLIQNMLLSRKKKLD